MIRERIDGLVCDLDGVIYRGDDPVPGAVEAVACLRAVGIGVVFCTNNSASTRKQYLDKLRHLGIPVDDGQVVTSGVVTAEALQARGATGKRAIVVGGEGLREELTGIGVVIDDDPQAREADIVVVGWDRRFDYDAMRRAAMAVRAGASFIASNADASFPAADGIWPGAGAILASITAASGRTPEVMGKPNRAMMEVARSRLVGRDAIAVVGDRDDTDLAGGRAMGWKTILVLSGVTSPEEAEKLDPQPNWVLEGLSDICPG